MPDPSREPKADDRSPRRLPWRPFVAAAILGISAGAAAFSTRELLPAEGSVARGVRVGGVDASGPGARAAAEIAARRALERRVTLTWGTEALLDASLEELGATVDIQRAAAAAAAIAREGGLLARLDAALEAQRGRVDIPVRVSLPVEPLAARLAELKEERDAPPVAAKLDVANRTATEHTPGRYLDVYAAAEAIARAAEGPEGKIAIAIPAFEIAPRASREVVAAIDASVIVSRFETRFGYVGDQVGRAQNVARAASQMEGVVLMPGDVVSFNANVGPRSLENGFAEAPEIYKGEMREGVGGGTCQVAGTLHAAAYLAGVEVVERSNHSRPSGYIRMGLDATVVYPTVDLKLKNPYDFPIVLHASIDKGTLVFELLGKGRPATVSFDTATVGVADYKRKIEEIAGMPEGKVRLKQKGIRGYSIKKTRTIHLAAGGDRIEVTTDTYPPTFEIYQVAPGTDVDAVLPPLPDGRTAANDGAAAPQIAAPAPPH